MRFGFERVHSCETNTKSRQCECERDADVYLVDARVRVAWTRSLGRLVAILGYVIIPILEVGGKDAEVGYEECGPDCY
jgi:hypothetical protein